MPFYEYECASCKYYTEVMQKITDSPLRKCPSCGRNALKKLVSAPVFRLKGDGWYETDFKSDKENRRNLAETEKEESKTETKSDKAASAESSKPASDGKSAESKPAAGTRKSVAVSKPSRAPARKPARRARAKPASRARSRARR